MTIEEQAHQQAKEHNLGALEYTLDADGSSSRNGMIACFVLLFITLLPISCIRPPAGTSWWQTEGGICIIGIGFILLAVGLAMLQLWNQAKRTHLFAYQGGLVLTGNSGVTLFPWGEIKTVWRVSVQYVLNGIPGATMHEYSLEKKDGTKRRLGS